MYPVSQAFLEAVKRPHTAIIRATVMLDGLELGDLRILDGSVTIDARREVLRSASLSVAPDDDAWQWLTTYGAEIKLWRGVRLPTGDELVPLGRFVVDGDIGQTDDEAIAVTAAGLTTRVARNRWTDPYAIAAGTDVGTALAALIQNRYPNAAIGFTTTGTTLGAQVVLQAGADTNPWKNARDIAEAASLDLYEDGDGVFRLRTIPDPTTTLPVATYEVGELSIIVSETRKASMGSVYNGVVATGEGSGLNTPVRGEAWDDDPTSPTYRLGPLGQIPYFYSSPMLATVAQCTAAATSRLSRIRGRVEGMSWELIVNPAHEALDVVDIIGDTRRRFMLDEVAIPLKASDTMKATARETRVV